MEKFAKVMDKWFKPHYPKKVCIAVSGGVDSMALTHLTSRYFAGKNVELMGVVVNHNLRAKSNKEAKEVVKMISKMGVKGRLTKISWDKNEIISNIEKFESLAREKRILELQKACILRNCGHLLFAHTLDDQIETMLMRLTTGSYMRGLAGIKENVKNWQVAAPNEVPINLMRPLLDFEKDELYQICKENNVEWFEDHTNFDPTFTSRNAIRKILAEEKSLLPKALQKSELIKTLKKFQEKRDSFDREIDELMEILSDNYKLQLDESMARVTFTEFEGFHLLKTSTLALLLQRITNRIIPVKDSGYSSSRFYKLATEIKAVKRNPGSDYISPAENKKVFTSCKLSWQLYPARSLETEEGYTTTVYKWTVERQPPYRSKETSLLFLAQNEWSEYKLFDDRFWVRVKARGLGRNQRLNIAVKYPKVKQNDVDSLKRLTAPQKLKLPWNSLRIQPVVYLMKGDDYSTSNLDELKSKDVIEDDSIVLGLPLIKNIENMDIGEGLKVDVECKLKQDSGDGNVKVPLKKFSLKDFEDVQIIKSFKV